MTFKAKAYPFPVLQPDYANFLDSEIFEVQFSLEVSSLENDNKQLLSSQVSLKNGAIESLLIDGQAKVYAEVYVAETISRHLVEIGMGSNPVDISHIDLVGTVEITGVILAEEVIEAYTPENAIPEFKEISPFRLECGDVISYGHTEYFEISLDHNAQPDLVRIEPIQDQPPHYYDFTFEGNVITIKVSTELMKYWKVLKQDSSKKHLLFTNIYRDCMQEAIVQLGNSTNGEQLWFKVLNAQLVKLNIDWENREPRDVATQLVYAQGFGKVIENEQSE
jgi:hypothetical protein